MIDTSFQEATSNFETAAFSLAWCVYRIATSSKRATQFIRKAQNNQDFYWISKFHLMEFAFLGNEHLPDVFGEGAETC